MRAMTSAARQRAVLFADLVGSTRLYDALGDREAHGITAGCLSGIIQIVERLGGEVIKTIGDEVMATFLTADAAFGCAEAIIAGVRGGTLGSEKSPGVHVGFHFGPVIEEAGDVFGDTVNVAAHMVAMAENQRILTTGPTAAHLDDGMRKRLRRIDRVEIKGRRDPIDVFELTTGNETLIRFTEAAPTEAPAAAEPSLTLFCGERRHVLTGQHCCLTIGRDENNDVVLSSPSASRFHARIEWRRHAFYLVDRSTNGTLVVHESGRVTTLRREWLRIDGSGSFGVGGSTQARPDEPIRFECREIKPARNSGPTTGR
jgi:class 3 adenylate cyclase